MIGSGIVGMATDSVGVRSIDAVVVGDDEEGDWSATSAGLEVVDESSNVA